MTSKPPGHRSILLGYLGQPSKARSAAGGGGGSPDASHAEDLRRQRLTLQLAIIRLLHLAPEDPKMELLRNDKKLMPLLQKVLWQGASFQHELSSDMAALEADTAISVAQFVTPICVYLLHRHRRIGPEPGDKGYDMEGAINQGLECIKAQEERLTSRSAAPASPCARSTASVPRPHQATVGQLKADLTSQLTAARELCRASGADAPTPAEECWALLMENDGELGRLLGNTFDTPPGRKLIEQLLSHNKRLLAVPLWLPGAMLRCIERNYSAKDPPVKFSVWCAQRFALMLPQLSAQPTSETPHEQIGFLVKQIASHTGQDLTVSFVNMLERGLADHGFQQFCGLLQRQGYPLDKAEDAPDAAEVAHGMKLWGQTLESQSTAARLIWMCMREQRTIPPYGQVLRGIHRLYNQSQQLGVQTFDEDGRHQFASVERFLLAVVANLVAAVFTIATATAKEQRFPSGVAAELLAVTVEILNADSPVRARLLSELAEMPKLLLVLVEASVADGETWSRRTNWLAQELLTRPAMQGHPASRLLARKIASDAQACAACREPYDDERRLLHEAAVRIA